MKKKLVIKRMKRRKWPYAKKMRVLRAREKHRITVKKVCQRYDISFAQYYRWKRKYLGKSV